MIGVGPHWPKGEEMCSFLLIGSAVDPQIKAKIVAKKFIELGSLLPKSRTAKSNVNMQYNQETTNFEFSSAKTKEPNNITEWVFLFHIYMGIYIAAHPSEAISMLTYMNKIIDMQKEEPYTYYWRTFDETFRRFKAGCHGAPWHIIHPNLAGDARSEYIRNAPQNSQNSGTNSYRGRGGFSRGGQGQGRGRGRGVPAHVPKFDSLCRHFNEGHCPYVKCKFQHKCSNCNYNHPLLLCRKAGGSSAAGAASFSSPVTTAAGVQAPKAQPKAK